MARLELFFLGTPRILVDGVEQAADRRKAVALLATLALRPQPAGRATLAGLLWPESDTSSAYAYLRRALWELNRALGEGWIEAGRESIGLRPSPDLWLDVAAFRQRLKDCPPDAFAPACLAALEEAVALYRGDFLADFALPDCPEFEEWQFLLAEELRRSLAGALAQLSSGYEQAGEYEKAAAHARRWLALDPLHEPAACQLMRLYARRGQLPAALRQYDQLVQVLQNELGVSPQPETIALYEQIRRGGSQAGPRPVSPAALHPPEPVSLPARRPQLNLPVQLSPFVGRQAELEEIARLLGDPACRVLTLHGPGGIGKTRLAIQAAQEQAGRFADGVCFLPLAGLTAPAAILPALLRALGLPFEEGRPANRQLADYLHARQMLLVLDNYEHLIDDESAALPLELISAGEGIKVLITSRQRLNVLGEQLYPVRGMRLPTRLAALTRPEELEAFSAVRLFLQGARRQRPDFSLDAHNMDAIRQICDLLQGMPLAIELAAGWSELLSPAEILTEIQTGLDFLESRRRDVPARQRSMRAVFESSLNLLSPEEGRMFCALSVFKGGFSRPAAQAVAGAGLAALASLEGKSLLQVAGPGRYTLHPLLAEYAAETLQHDRPAWEAAHDGAAAYFCQVILQAVDSLKGRDQAAALTAIEADFQNILEAWNWVIERRQFEHLDRLVSGLVHFATSGGQLPAQFPAIDASIAVLEALQPAGELETLLLAKLYIMGAHSRFDISSSKPGRYFRRALELARQVDGERKLGFYYTILASGFGWRVEPLQGIEMLQQAIEFHRQAGDEWAAASAQRMLGDLLIEVSRRKEAAVYLLQAAQAFRKHGDQVSLAMCLMDLGQAYHELSENSQANRYFQEGLAIMESLDYKPLAAGIHFTLADILSTEGDYTGAIQHYEKSLRYYEEAGDQPLVASVFSWESITLARMGDTARARHLRQRSLAISSQLNDRNGIMWSTYELGEIERLEGNFAAARRLYEESRQLFEESRLFSLLPFYERSLGEMALAEGSLAQARQAFEKSLAVAREGYHTWASSCALSALGRTALAQGALEQAQEYFEEALQLGASINNPGIMLVTLAGVARLLAQRGQAGAAAGLAEFVLRCPATWSETRQQARAALEEAVQRALDPTLAAAAREAAAGMELKGVVEDLFKSWIGEIEDE